MTVLCRKNIFLYATIVAVFLGTLALPAYAEAGIS